FAADFRPVVETLAGENFFQNRTFWSAVHVSSRPFFEKFRHLAAGTLAFDPVHDLGKLSAVEDEGKAPIPGVDTLPILRVVFYRIHECTPLDVLPSVPLQQRRGRFVFGRVRRRASS
uniref:hypothetical protein n=1 Tax=Bilophila wadsworthia TaxID=35833 RepID=UPI003FEE1329